MATANFRWIIKYKSESISEIAQSMESYQNIMEVYQELLLAVFNPRESNYFLRSYTFGGLKDGADLRIKVYRGTMRPLRFNSTLELRTHRQIRRKRTLAVQYGMGFNIY